MIIYENSVAFAPFELDVCRFESSPLSFIMISQWSPNSESKLLSLHFYRIKYRSPLLSYLHSLPLLLRIYNSSSIILFTFLLYQISKHRSPLPPHPSIPPQGPSPSFAGPAVLPVVYGLREHAILRESRGWKQARDKGKGGESISIRLLEADVSAFDSSKERIGI